MLGVVVVNVVMASRLQLTASTKWREHFLGDGRLAGRASGMHSLSCENRNLVAVIKPRKSTMRLCKVAALALIVAAPTSVSLARAPSDCSTLTTVADWGENSTADIDLKSGESCLFQIKKLGTVSSSEISQKPVHGKLKRLNISTFQYTAKARYKGSDTFAIKATGQGQTASGTSVISVNATIK